MVSRFVGYARTTGEQREHTAIREHLIRLGVSPARIHLDDGFGRATGARPQLQAALAECRTGDTLVTTQLERLARSVKDAHDLTTGLEARNIRVNIDGHTYNPATTAGAVFFETVALMADLDAGLSRHRTQTLKRPIPAPGAAASKGRAPSPTQEEQLILLHETGDYTVTELAAMFKIPRSVIYRITERYAREQRAR